MKEYDIVFADSTKPVHQLMADIEQRVVIDTRLLGENDGISYILYRYGLLLLTLKNGETIACHNLVLSSVVDAAPSILEQDEDGKVIVDGNHSVKNVPNIYMLGRSCSSPAVNSTVIRTVANHIIAVNNY